MPQWPRKWSIPRFLINEVTPRHYRDLARPRKQSSESMGIPCESLPAWEERSQGNAKSQMLNLQSWIVLAGDATNGWGGEQPRHCWEEHVKLQTTSLRADIFILIWTQTFEGLLILEKKKSKTQKIIKKLNRGLALITCFLLRECKN